MQNATSIMIRLQRCGDRGREGERVRRAVDLYTHIRRGYEFGPRHLEKESPYIRVNTTNIAANIRHGNIVQSELTNPLSGGPEKIVKLFVGQIIESKKQV